MTIFIQRKIIFLLVNNCLKLVSFAVVGLNLDRRKYAFFSLRIFLPKFLKFVLKCCTELATVTGLLKKDKFG